MLLLCYAAVVTLRSICLLFFGMLYSTMPDCIEHLIAFFIVHCSILYSVLFYRVRCWVDGGVYAIIQFFFGDCDIIHILLASICL